MQTVKEKIAIIREMLNNKDVVVEHSQIHTFNQLLETIEDRCKFIDRVGDNDTDFITGIDNILKEQIKFHPDKGITCTQRASTIIYEIMITSARRLGREIAIDHLVKEHEQDQETIDRDSNIDLLNILKTVHPIANA